MGQGGTGVIGKEKVFWSLQIYTICTQALAILIHTTYTYRRKEESDIGKNRKGYGQKRHQTKEDRTKGRVQDIKKWRLFNGFVSRPFCEDCRY